MRSFLDLSFVSVQRDILDLRFVYANRANIVKLPFPLTIRFKSMLQSGVMTRDLDVQWVSSLSWYFLNLMGLQSVFGFILGSDNGTFS